MISTGKQHNFRYKLSDLAGELDNKQFFQINRSELINIEFVERIMPFFNDRVAIRIRHFKQQLITGAAHTAAFKRWLEG
jgi:DNA-binding LytR/AlgR family response regulator